MYIVSGTMSKVRHYCLTFFNEPKIKLPEGIRYAIYGEEIAPETGKKHWQTYIELYSPQRHSFIKKAYDDKTIHIEARQGTRDQAREYCMKDGKWEEFGKWIKGQGNRTDLEHIVERMKSGTKINEIMMDHSFMYCKYRNGLKDIAAEISRKSIPNWRDIDVEIISGPTGVGKTRGAFETLGYDAYKIEGRNLKWFQDYNGEKAIIIDEYDNDVPITHLLNLLDGYKLRLNVKGTHTFADRDWETF